MFSLSFPGVVLPACVVLALCLTTTKSLSAQTAAATTTLTVLQAPGAQAPRQGDTSISRDLVLERAALSERDKIDDMLSPSAKLKVNRVSETFLNTLLRDNNDVDPSQSVREAMGRQFGQLSSQQSDLLIFYTLAGVVQLLDERQGRNSGLSRKDMLSLQTYMDKRCKFYETLSNLMKKHSETSQAIIQNLK